VRSDKIWADVAVLGVAVVWGASYLVAKGALAYARCLFSFSIVFSSQRQSCQVWLGGTRRPRPRLAAVYARVLAMVAPP